MNTRAMTVLAALASTFTYACEDPLRDRTDERRAEESDAWRKVLAIEQRGAQHDWMSEGDVTAVADHVRLETTLFALPEECASEHCAQSREREFDVEIAQCGPHVSCKSEGNDVIAEAHDAGSYDVMLRARDRRTGEVVAATTAVVFWKPRALALATTPGLVDHRGERVGLAGEIHRVCATFAGTIPESLHAERKPTFLDLGALDVRNVAAGCVDVSARVAGRYVVRAAYADLEMEATLRLVMFNDEAPLEVGIVASDDDVRTPRLVDALMLTNGRPTTIAVFARIELTEDDALVLPIPSDELRATTSGLNVAVTPNDWTTTLLPRAAGIGELRLETRERVARALAVVVR